MKALSAATSDPDGVLNARPHAFRTAAFRQLETVGFPLSTTSRDILSSTIILFSWLDHVACLLVPSSFVGPLLGGQVDGTPDLLARLSSGGTCATHRSHPLGNHNQCHGVSPHSKVSGLPWRDQCEIRCGSLWWSVLAGKAAQLLHWMPLLPGERNV